MAQGYLVSLGDGQLGGGDAIGGGLTAFDPQAALGAGTWTFSGVRSDTGETVSNASGPGTYHLATNGDVYFVPDGYAVSNLSGGSAADAPAHDGTTAGTAANDVIAEDGGDDTIYGGAGPSETGTGADAIDAGGGDDTVLAGDGADSVTGGGGADRLFGGAGNDTLHGDDPTPALGGQETLNWTAQGPSGTSVAGGFVQDTGGMNVRVDYVDDGGGTSFATTNAATYRAPGETIATNSSGVLAGTGDGPTSTVRMAFDAENGTGLSNEVSGVQFRLNDVDTLSGSWQDVITIRAYDANGNPVAVTLTAAGNDAVSGGTVTAGPTSDTPSSAQGSVLVTVPGPVHFIEVIYSNVGDSSQNVYISNVQFTTAQAVDGADSVSGGEGDDTAFGGGGNDWLMGDAGHDALAGGAGDDALSGGVGNDTLSGGDGADRFAVGHSDGRDAVDGGEGGVDQDALAFTSAAGAVGVTVTFTASEAGTYAFNASLPTNPTATGTFTAIEAVEGTAFADTINAAAATSAATISGLGGDDSLTGGAGADVIDGGTGRDALAGGAGNDSLLGGDGADRLAGGAGADRINGGADADTVVLSDNAGADVIDGGAGGVDADTLDLSGQTNAATVTFTGAEAGQAGAATFTEIERLVMTGRGDTMDARAASSGTSVDGGAGGDTMMGGAGADTFEGGAGDDRFVLDDGFGSDAFTGGETGETAGDLLDAGAVGAPVTLILTAPETGTLSAGGSTASFSQVERFVLGSGDDSAQGSAGADDIATGAGADRVRGGAGDDRLDVGADAAADIVVLANGSGADTVLNFSAPVQFPDDVWTGTDRLDVTGLITDGRLVNVHDVVVTDDGAGNAVLTFPGGESVRLVGVDPASLASPFALAAMGIPLADGVVSGTAGADLIDEGYQSDPDDDRVDGGDALLPGAGPEDDRIEAGGGADTVFAGLGGDQAFGGDGADTLYGGEGDDALQGDAGDDTLDGGLDGDALFGGLGDDRLFGGEGLDALSGGDGADLIDGGAGEDRLFGGAGADTLQGGAGDDRLAGGADDDRLFGGDGRDDLSGDDGADHLSGGAGNDASTGGLGDDTLEGGAGADALSGGEGRDVLDGGDGADALDGGAGADTIFGGAGDDVGAGGADDDLLFGEAGSDRLDGGEGADTVYGGLGHDAMVAGGDGADAVSGRYGDDTLEGGAGDDTLYGDLDADGTGARQFVLYGLGASGEGSTRPDGTFEFQAGRGPVTLEVRDDDDRLEGRDAGGPQTLAYDVVIGGVAYPAGTAIVVVSRSEIENHSTGESGHGWLVQVGDDPEGRFWAFDIPVADGDKITWTTAKDAEDTGGPAYEDLIQADGTTATGDDSIAGGDGDDRAYGADGNDAIRGDAGRDSLYGGEGDDALSGGEGDDTLDGGEGRDALDGGQGADAMDGGAGDDALAVSHGDTALGGAGADTFTLLDLGEAPGGAISVEGGAGHDRLDLRGLAAPDDVVITGGDLAQGFTGHVRLLDGTMLHFKEIEDIICFAAGTSIATTLGARPVETLRPGDMVVTRDHGIQPIRWVGQRTVPAVGRFAPIRIRPGVVPGLSRDLVVSPQHRMLFQGHRAELLFGEREVLVPARHLVDGLSVTEEPGAWVTYVHLLFDTHEVIYAEGAATESFHPGEVGLGAIEEAAREEMFALFPALRSMPASYGRAARRSLKAHEARLIRP